MNSTDASADAPTWGDDADDLRADLLEWYDHHKRDLPWRRTDDPYAIWISEIMLQQTQVATVTDYWTRWMATYPDVETLAEADLDEVLEMWAGLGYYRRARFIHRAATYIVEECDGQLPDTVKGLKKMTGVGPYTAGAIASIAFGRPVPLVDGNVERVFARLRAIPGDPKDRDNQKLFWRLAEDLVDEQRPGDFNQSLMELGATICTPANPTCLLCPVRQHCEAFALGDPAGFPDTVKRARAKPVSVASLVVVAPDASGQRHFLAVRRPAEGLLSGMMEFPTTARVPTADAPEEGAWGASLREVFEGLELPLPAQAWAAVTTAGTVQHRFSHLLMTFHVHVVEVAQMFALPEHERERVWISDGSPLEDAAFSAAQRKVEKLAREHL